MLILHLVIGGPQFRDKDHRHLRPTLKANDICMGNTTSKTTFTLAISTCKTGPISNWQGKAGKSYLPQIQDSYLYPASMQISHRKIFKNCIKLELGETLLCICVEFTCSSVALQNDELRRLISGHSQSSVIPVLASKNCEYIWVCRMLGPVKRIRLDFRWTSHWSRKSPF